MDISERGIDLVMVVGLINGLSHARKGWEYYTANRIWYPDSDINTEGVKTLIQIYGEQGQLKGPKPSPARYVDQSYLKDALKELSNR